MKKIKPVTIFIIRPGLLCGVRGGVEMSVCGVVLIRIIFIKIATVERGVSTYVL
jgi:hypothetical protein